MEAVVSTVVETRSGRIEGVEENGDDVGLDHDLDDLLEVLDRVLGEVGDEPLGVAVLDHGVDHDAPDR